MKPKSDFASSRCGTGTTLANVQKVQTQIFFLPSSATICHGLSRSVTACRHLSFPAISFSCWLFESGQHRAMPAVNVQYRELKTFDAVVDKLGGLAAVGQLCDGQDVAAVCNWKRRRNVFPTKYYPVMRDELNKRGFDAPDDLWGFYKKKR
jgi:hypothetical protein